MVHSVTNRLNFLFSVTLSTLFTCCAILASTSYVKSLVSPCQPTGKIFSTQNLSPYTLWDPHPLLPTSRRHKHTVGIELNIQADFTQCMDWNTKQLFVYAVAEYETELYHRNEVTLWDTIVRNKKDAVFHVPRALEYRFQDIETGLVPGTNVTVRLKFHQMSHSGWTDMRYVADAETTFKMDPPK